MDFDKLSLQSISHEMLYTAEHDFSYIQRWFWNDIKQECLTTLCRSRSDSVIIFGIYCRLVGYVIVTQSQNQLILYTEGGLVGGGRGQTLKIFKQRCATGDPEELWFWETKPYLWSWGTLILGVKTILVQNHLKHTSECNIFYIWRNLFSHINFRDNFS